MQSNQIVAAFDFDGTITTSDSLRDFVHYTVGRGRLVLVSASPALYLRHWAADAGFDAVLATEIEFRDGGFSGSFTSPNCWGAEKVRRLQHWFASDPPDVLYAYGDSLGDREMLALADHAWLRGLGAIAQDR